MAPTKDIPVQIFEMLCWTKSTPRLVTTGQFVISSVATLRTSCDDFLSRGNGTFEFVALWNLNLPFGSQRIGSQRAITVSMAFYLQMFLSCSPRP